MRIGIITHNYPQNKNDRKDAGIFLYDFAHELSKEHEVFVLAPNFVGNKDIDKKVPVTWFRWSGGAKKLGNLSFRSMEGVVQTMSLLLNGTMATYRFSKENNLDFVVAAWAFPSGFFAFCSGIFTKIPYGTWSLGSDINIYAKYPLSKQLIATILKKAHIRFANSYALCARVSSLSGKKCVFLPAVTNINTRIVKKTSPKRIFTFLFVGRLEHVKGVDILLEALSYLSPRKKWAVLIGGDGSKSEDLKKQIQNTSYEKRVTFLGRLDEDEVPKYMANSDFLVVPSRSESLPLVMIEAAKMSLPTIAADVGDCKRIIKTYNIGEFFTKERPKDLAMKMNKVLRFKKSKYAKGLQSFAADFTQEKAISIFVSSLKIKA